MKKIILGSSYQSKEKKKKFWSQEAKKNNLKLDTFGLDALAQFRIKSENFQKYKTFISQEMLKEGYLLVTLYTYLLNTLILFYKNIIII